MIVERTLYQAVASAAPWEIHWVPESDSCNGEDAQAVFVLQEIVIGSAIAPIIQETT